MPFKFRRGNEDVEVTSKDIIGLTEDEVKEKFGKIDNVVASQAETKTTLDALVETIKGLEGKLTQVNARGNRQNNNDDDDDDERPELTNEQKAINLALSTSLESKADRAKDKVSMKQENEFWNQFEAEIEELTKNDPITLKTQTTYWQNAYDVVVGRHVKDIQDGKIKVKRMHFVESGSVSATQNVEEDKNKPSELDVRQAEKFHMPIDKYMERKAKMVFVR